MARDRYVLYCCPICGEPYLFPGQCDRFENNGPHPKKMPQLIRVICQVLLSEIPKEGVD